MKDRHEWATPVEDEELRRVKEKKLEELMRFKEEEKEITARPVNITDSNFSTTVSKHPLALIDCWAARCGPCLAIAPAIEELAKDYAGRALVGRLNVDENPKTATDFRIFSIPTLLIIKDGEEVDRIVGLVPKRHIESYLRKHLR